MIPSAAVSMAGAALIHIMVAPAHLDPLSAEGLFFLISGAIQGLWAVGLAFSSDRVLVMLGVVGNAFLIAMWAASRSTGIPLVHPGTEPIGIADLSAVSLQATSIVAMLRHSKHHSHRHFKLASAITLSGTGAALAATSGTHNLHLILPVAAAALFCLSVIRQVAVAGAPQMRWRL